MKEDSKRRYWKSEAPLMQVVTRKFRPVHSFGRRLWGLKGRGSEIAPEHYRIVSDQDAVLSLARVKGYVCLETIAGAAVLKLLNLSL